MHPWPEHIRVVIVDGITASRRRLAGLLVDTPDIEIGGAARTAAEGLQLTQVLAPHVVVLAATPDGDPLQTIRQLAATPSNVYVVLVTVSSDMQFNQQAFLAGAQRIVPYPSSVDQLTEAIRASRS